jgi:integrase/recombinase XerD
MFPELNSWSDFMTAQGRSEGTIRRYRYVILRFLSETPKDSLAEIGEQDVVTFLASLGDRGPAKKHYLRALASFWEWAARRAIIPTDPTNGLNLPAVFQKPPDAYSVEEILRLVEAANAHSERQGLAITLCYSLGLRRSEVCGITPDDVDWEGRRVYIRCAKGNRPRWVEANQIALGALIALRPYWKDTVLGNMAPQWFTMITNQAARESGLPPNRRRAHMLRASFATHLLGEGAPISVVSRLLGHASVAVTTRYLAVSDEDRRKAVNLLNLPPSRPPGEVVEFPGTWAGERSS